MSSMFDLRCSTDDNAGLHGEIARRDKIIRALMHQVEQSLDAPDNDYALLQSTFVLEDEVKARQQAERQVRELLERQQVIFDNAHVGIILAKQRKIVSCNRHMAEMFGYRTPEELIGQSTRVLFPSQESFVRTGKLLYRQMAEQGHAQSESELVRRDGTSLWVMLTGRPLSATDVLEASIWVYTDITERRQQAARLSLANCVFNNSLEALLITDGQTRIQDVNQAFCRITGYSREDVLGKTPALMKSGRHDAEFYGALWQSLLSNGAWEGEIWDRRKNGQIFPKWLSITVVRDEDGAIQNYIGCFSDISTRKAAEERIYHMAHHDPLTSLPNRVQLRIRYLHMLELQRRTGRRLAVMFLDLDHFKRINDSLGHPVGDGLLLAVVGRLRACLRDSDTLSRQGGDEFIILLGDLETGLDATVIARKLLAAMQEPFKVDEHVLNTSTSIGIAIAPDDGSDFDTLMQRADTAMYHAKESGRGQFSFFSREMKDQAQRRLEIGNRLRRAIDTGELSLVYQPQVYADSGEVFGAEALLRWQIADGTMIPPSEFIPLAEESGLILPLGEFVIAETSRQIRLWHDMGNQWKIAINISGAQIFRCDVVELLHSHIRDAGITPQLLEVELTESTLVEDTVALCEVIRQLRQLGISIAIDDFGTGYSSLSYLKRFNINKLKIDRAFISDLDGHPSSDGSPLSQLIINIAHTLRLRVIAEGVETARQLDLIRRQGCNEIQGYYFSRPLNPEGFLRFAKKQHSC